MIHVAMNHSGGDVFGSCYYKPWCEKKSRVFISNLYEPFLLHQLQFILLFYS